MDFVKEDMMVLPIKLKFRDQNVSPVIEIRNILMFRQLGCLCEVLISLCKRIKQHYRARQ